MTRFSRMISAGVLAVCAVAVQPIAMQAATVTPVNTTINFNDGTLTGGPVKTYTEGGYQFTDARIVGGPCAGSGPDKCAGLNPKEETVVTRVGGGAFDLISLWLYLNGKAKDGGNSLTIFETGNMANLVSYTQPAYEHNKGYTVSPSFTNVTSLTFVSSGPKDKGNARFDNLAFRHYTVDDTPDVPLPAAGWMMLAAIGTLAVLRRRLA